ncbi:MAG: MalY/PatB family protein, partial [Oscillospiraceae bacterium]
NPVGRVWTREELSRVSAICCRHGVVVVSDEIHNDLVYGGTHTIFAAVSPEAEQNCVVCTAPSKSFNIPGLITSNIFVPNASLRERFRRETETNMGHFLNPTGIAAGTAAYEQGGPWLDELCAYLKENAELFRALVAEKLPRAWVPKMEGTYLAWLDLGYLGLSDGELEELVVKKAQLLVNMGVTYGAAGSGFVRVNIGCPRRYVRAFVERLARVVDEL